jgi:hypothetical protein
MSRVPSLLVSASFLASIPFLALGPTPALAASPTEQAAECAASAPPGGTCTYSKVGSQVSCTCTSTTTQGGGNDNNSTITTTSGNTTNGNLDNGPQTDPIPPTCSGPGKSTNHC